MFQLENLNFKVGKVIDAETNVATPFYATKRLDNGKALGIVAKGYKIFQPSEMLETVQKLCDNTGFELYGDFAINDGKKVLLSVKTGDVKIGDDNIIKQINITNSYDRSSGINFNLGSLTIRCSNQFSKIVKGSQFNFNHNSKMFENIENMIQSIRLLNNEETEYYGCLSKFVSTPLSKDLASRIIAQTLDIQFDNSNDVLLFDEDLSTRKSNIFDRFMNDYETEQADLGQTVYTLFNSATAYSTKTIKSPFSGVGLKISNDIFNKCLQLI
jgi:hypothetical protein